MSAHEVVAAHMLAGHVSHPDYDANPYADQEGPFIATPLCRCGRQVEDYPAHLLDALRGNGFAVVELPEVVQDGNDIVVPVPTDRPHPQTLDPHPMGTVAAHRQPRPRWGQP